MNHHTRNFSDPNYWLLVLICLAIAAIVSYFTKKDVQMHIFFLFRNFINMLFLSQKKKKFVCLLSTNNIKGEILETFLSKNKRILAMMKEQETVLTQSFDCFAHLKRGFRVYNIF